MEFAKTLLVLGGARSGKSGFAQRAAEAQGGELVYVASAQAFDEEMAARIARHQGERDARWRTVEAPVALAAAIGGESRAGRVVLVDCLTLWASNLLLAGEDIAAHTAALTQAIAAAPGRIVLVANEVGLGIVPDNPLARAFRDAAGEINQAVAAVADAVVFVAAGLPLRLK